MTVFNIRANVAMKNILVKSSVSGFKSLSTLSFNTNNDPNDVKITEEKTANISQLTKPNVKKKLATLASIQMLSKQESILKNRINQSILKNRINQ